ncbi:MAG: rRNA maturation RNase YbeY [Firmicutes bacterium]|nr:rRNA maturation RNase YbeY [Bacillota bacterium]
MIPKRLLVNRSYELEGHVYAGEPLEASVEEDVIRALEVAAEFEGLAPASVDLYWVDDAVTQQLNQAFRGIDRATDVLSFPLTEPGEPPVIDPDTGCRLLGEIVISVDRLRAQASEYGHSVAREAAFLAVHGLLHLLGYDHEEADAEAEMFGKQEAILQRAGITREGG